MTSIRTGTVLLTVALLAACSTREKVAVTAPQGNWIALFNGHDLEGWTVKISGHEVGDNYRNTFRVEDGVLKVSYRQYDEKFHDRFGSLFYNKPFSHYWIRVEYRMSGELARGAPSWAYKNSGIQLHGQAPQSMRREQQFPVNVEFDLVGGRRFGSQPTGDVCQSGTHVLVNGQPLKDMCSKVSDITIRDDQWVTALAEVDGDKRVRQVVNGALVIEYTNITLDDSNPDARRMLDAGHARSLASGYISLQSNGFPIEFRKVEVMPLDEPSAPASTAPAAEPAAPTSTPVTRK
jgi:3-keto-disaccharide hydrolase